MPETTHSFNTSQGKFDVIKYSNGAEHVYKVEDGGKQHISNDKVIEAHHDPALQEKWDQEREEQARKAGDVALDSVHGEPEQPAEAQPLRTGEAFWQKAKDDKNKVKVTVLGPSPDLPGGIDPHNNVLYVELVTDSGSHYSKVRADRLDYPESKLAGPSADSRQAGEEMDEQADEAVAKLDEVIPPSEKEKKEAEEAEAYAKMNDFEKALHRFDKAQKKRDEKLEKALRGLDLWVQGKTDEAAKLIAEARGEAKEGGRDDNKPEDKPDKDNDRVEEYRSKDASGHDVILRRKLSDGSWRISRNGDNPRTWEDINESQAQSFGIEPGVTQPNRVLTGEDNGPAPDEEPREHRRCGGNGSFNGPDGGHPRRNG